MTFNNNFSISKLFMGKDITVYADNKPFIIRVHSIKEFYENPDLNSVYHLWTSSLSSIQKLYFTEVKDSFDAMTTMIFEYGQYGKYRDIANKMRAILPLFLPQVNIDMTQKEIKVNDITMTSEIWEYILYILKLSCGEKVNQPLSFDSEEARKFYMAQREQEEKIAKLKQSHNGDKDGLAKVLLSITYAFPSITIDYLCNQTMAQIQWLQKYAAGAMSYEVNAQAMAAGNMKKGKKLDFFIK